MEIIYLILGIVLGGLIIGLFLKSKKGISKHEADNLNKKIIELTEDRSNAEAKKSLLEKDLKINKEELSTEREKIFSLNSAFSEVNTKNENLLEKLENQKKEIEDMQTKFTDAFENLANKIFEEKSSKFTEKNRANLDEILKPLKEKIMEFENKVEFTHKENLKTNISLIEQIRNLEKLNKQISDDASNLTKALKGDVKVQGNWGEVILEKTLEESGLRKGIEYETQGRGMGLKSEEGTPSKPDFIIKFPDNKHIIIDSKVSLIAYERLVNSETEEQKKGYRKELERSIRSHIDDLHNKHYQTREGLNTPDYVFLFMPIEASFTIALHPDSSLFKYALDKKVIIIGPSGLMAILRTIESIWRQDNQTKHAMEIARQSGNLYDAFVRMLEDLEKVGVNIERSNRSFQDAIKKLSTGRGNLISRVENIKKLGAKASKNIPEKFIEEDVTDMIE